MKGWCDMKKSIEKIIEKLEEYRDENLVEHDSEMANHCKQDCNDVNDCTLCVWNKAIEIVKQEAEQYNNGWIPCSERLPEENSNVIACFAHGLVTELTFYDGLFHGIYEYTTSVIIAWQPLPAPYQPKGE